MESDYPDDRSLYDCMALSRSTVPIKIKFTPQVEFPQVKAPHQVEVSQVEVSQVEVSQVEVQQCFYKNMRYIMYPTCKCPEMLI